MILHINTTEGHDIEVTLRDGEKQIAKKIISAKYAQAEKLLPLIDKILKSKKLSIKDVKEIEVNNSGGSFTALRIGVVTANALGYALKVSVKGEAEDRMSKDVKFSVVEPKYSKEPNITTKKS